MRIAFVGKGGSGKTTLASLFIKYLANRQLPVMAIDADVNQHLLTAVGFSDDNRPKSAIGDNFLPVVRYLVGTNERIGDIKHFRASTPPGRGSCLIRDWRTDELINLFSASQDGVVAVTTGEMAEENVGATCYHGKWSAVETLLNHLVDGLDDFVVTDLTAGADTFSTGLFEKFDLLAVVVEPTAKSVSVYHQFKRLLADRNLAMIAIGNKVSDSADVDYLVGELGDDLLGCLPASVAVKAADRGQAVTTDEYEDAFSVVFGTLLNRLTSRPKDWDRYHALVVRQHCYLADRWLNANFGFDFTSQIDPEFSGADYLR